MKDPFEEAADAAFSGGSTATADPFEKAADKAFSKQPSDPFEDAADRVFKPASEVAVSPSFPSGGGGGVDVGVDSDSGDVQEVAHTKTPKIAGQAAARAAAKVGRKDHAGSGLVVDPAYPKSGLTAPAGEVKIAPEALEYQKKQDSAREKKAIEESARYSVLPEEFDEAGDAGWKAIKSARRVQTRVQRDLTPITQSETPTVVSGTGAVTAKESELGVPQVIESAIEQKREAITRQNRIKAMREKIGLVDVWRQQRGDTTSAADMTDEQLLDLYASRDQTDPIKIGIAKRVQQTESPVMEREPFTRGVVDETLTALARGVERPVKSVLQAGQSVVAQAASPAGGEIMAAQDVERRLAPSPRLAPSNTLTPEGQFLTSAVESVPQLFAQIGASIATGGSSAAFVTTAVLPVMSQTYNDTFKAVVDAGGSADAANKAALPSAIANGIVTGLTSKAEFRFLQADPFARRSIQTFIANRLRGVAAEGLQEATEQANQEASDYLVRAANDMTPIPLNERFDRIALAGAGGGLVGGLLPRSPRQPIQTTTETPQAVQTPSKPSPTTEAVPAKKPVQTAPTPVVEPAVTPVLPTAVEQSAPPVAAPAVLQSGVDQPSAVITTPTEPALGTEPARTTGVESSTSEGIVKVDEPAVSPADLPAPTKPVIPKTKQRAVKQGGVKATEGTVEGVTAKQPWEMTVDELDRTYKPNIPAPKDGATASLNGQPATYSSESGRFGWTFKSNAGPSIRVTDPSTIDRLNHQVAVKEAIDAGKPVPAEVLADYPDLAPKPSTTPKAQESGVTSERQEIDKAAFAASKMTRKEYDAAGLSKDVLGYDLARQAAKDRGLDLVRNVDVDNNPSNVGAAILKMIDDARAEKGLPRKHEKSYAPVETVTGGESSTAATSTTTTLVVGDAVKVKGMGDGVLTKIVGDRASVKMDDGRKRVVPLATVSKKGTENAVQEREAGQSDEGRGSQQEVRKEGGDTAKRGEEVREAQKGKEEDGASGRVLSDEGGKNRPSKGLLGDEGGSMPLESVIRGLETVGTRTFEFINGITGQMISSLRTTSGRLLGRILDRTSSKAATLVGKIENQAIDAYKNLTKADRDWMAGWDNLGYGNMQRILENVISGQIPAPNPRIQAITDAYKKMMDVTGDEAVKLGILRETSGKNPTGAAGKKTKKASRQWIRTNINAILKGNPGTPPTASGRKWLTTFLAQNNAASRANMAKMLAKAGSGRDRNAIIKSIILGKITQFRKATSGRFLRQFTQDANQAIFNESGPLYEAIARAIERDNPGVTYERAKEFMKQYLGPQAVRRVGSIEDVREIKNIPVMVQVQGEWVPILESDPLTSIMSAAQSQARRMYFADEVGQGLMGQATGVDRLRQKHVNAGGDADAFDASLKVFHHRPYGRIWKNPRNFFARTGRVFNALIGTAQTSGSVLPNLPQPMMIASTTGVGNLFRGFAKALRHPKMTAAQAAAMGAMHRSAIEWVVRKGQVPEDIARIVRSVVGRVTGLHWVAQFNNMVAANAGLELANYWRNNGATDKDLAVMRQLRLTMGEQNAIMRGKMTDDIRNKIVQNVVKTTQFVTEDPHRQSVLQNVPILSALFSYNNYLIGTTKQTLRHVDDIFRSFSDKRGDTPQAMRRMLLYLTSVLGAAAVGYMLRQASKGKDVIPKDEKQAKDMMLDVLFESQVLGPAQRALDVQRFNHGDATNAIVAFSPKMRFFADFVNAFAGLGRMGDMPKDQRLLDMFRRNTTAWNSLHQLIDNLTAEADMSAYGRVRRYASEYQKDKGKGQSGAVARVNPEYWPIRQAYKRGEIKEAEKLIEEYRKRHVDDEDHAIENLKSSLQRDRPINMSKENMDAFLESLPPDIRKEAEKTQDQYEEWLNDLIPKKIKVRKPR